MGLKTTNYKVEDYGVVLDTAYAQLASVDINLKGEAYSTFEIQQTREGIGVNNSFESKFFSCTIDKNQPIHKQIYEKAKKELFTGWEDDIVDENVDAVENN